MMDNTCNPFGKEVDAYMTALLSMLEHHEEEYTIFVGNDCLGFCDSWENACIAGSIKTSNAPILVRKVSREYLPENYGREGEHKFSPPYSIG